ncbi:branched chain amino acid ABC transporter substrate-binding protein [Burkholderia sp. THE68]|uniref:ABC transporter substrate-binding protein n=1 Tax=Burkholderiaceae TaxID=119060 RepID=UPI0013177B2D|nr:MULTISPECIES: ABC transporter substrate-binding protein [Burkholderiaceae]BBU30578.1 branched chain amino acid ABC transporter substrate-binding protein [Burkholderia sp. THE68]BCQ29438.1 ABC transporter substrate-binding protein [Caballeronia sp. NK8]
MNVLRKLCPILCPATLALALAASPAWADDAVHVAFTGTLTGDFATYGVSGKKGFDLAIADINAQGGPKIEVDTVDDHGQPNDGVLAANRFCGDDNTVAVVGYTFSSIALAAVPLYKKCKMPTIGTAVTSPQLSNASPWFRRVVLTDAIQGKMMGQYTANQLHVKTVYTLYQQDDYGLGVNGAFKSAYQEAGGKIVGEGGYVLGTKDFRTILTKVKAAHPDGLFIGGFYTEAAQIVTQAKALGIDAKILGTDGSLSPQLISLSNNAVDGMTLYGMFDPDASSHSSSQSAAFVKAFTAKYGQAPDSWAALGYDAGLAIGNAVKAAKAKGPVTRDSVNAALSSVNVTGVTGPVAFEKSGDRKGTLYFFTAHDGKFALAGQQK